MSVDHTRVWIFEDNDIYRHALSKTIHSIEGMECLHSFPNAESMVEQLMKGDSPDLILLDVQLPGMDGLTVLKKLKSTSPDTKALILTAFVDDEKIYKAICSGASGYLLKSALKEDIVSALHEVVAGGAPMTPSVAQRVLALFAKMGEGAPKKENAYELSERELSVLELMGEGLIKKEIADRLSLSTHTVNSHIRSIYAKLHVDTNTGAVAKGIREELI